jgi:addiction module HigA family antidote
MPKVQQTPASVLLSLMDEYQFNPFSLSKEIKLSTSAIRQLVIGKSKVTVPTALRLAKFFNQSPAFWLDLQRETDLSEAAKDKELQAILKDIIKAKKPSASSKPKTSSKGTRKKATSNDKRKKAAKIPGAKPSRGRPSKKSKK